MTRLCLLILVALLSGVNSFRKDHHHNNNEVESILQNVHKKCASITRLTTLKDFKGGTKTTLNNNLTVIEFGLHPGEHVAGIPEFKYIGNMHGNEVVSREIMLGLIVHLCDKYLAKDPTIQKLIQKTRIHILPSMNPDGWAIASRASYHDRNIVTGRRTALNIDLNRNFPPLNDIVYLHTFTHKGKIDHVLKKAGLDPDALAVETQMVIDWMLPIPFVLSANFHGGELVANYPYDQSYDKKQSMYTRTPDDSEFRRLSLAYSTRHPTMWEGGCRKRFKDGIVNGAAWYSVRGGMQDFNYLATNCFELTIEVSCKKYPKAFRLPYFHAANMPAMLGLMWEVHTGVKGSIRTRKNGKLVPVHGARVTVWNLKKPKRDLHAIVSAKDGDYYRLLPNGTFAVTVTEGSRSHTKCLTIQNDPKGKGPTELNFILTSKNMVSPACPLKVQTKLGDNSITSVARFLTWKFSRADW